MPRGGKLYHEDEMYDDDDEYWDEEEEEWEQEVAPKVGNPSMRSLH
jgi:hypothetical protein